MEEFPGRFDVSDRYADGEAWYEGEAISPSTRPVGFGAERDRSSVPIGEEGVREDPKPQPRLEEFGNPAAYPPGEGSHL